MSFYPGISVAWFVALGSISILSLSFGRWLGNGPSRRAWLGLIAGVLGMGLWGWLANSPAVAVRAIPSGLLCYLEGTAAVPIFMMVIGIIWSRSACTRQKKAALVGSIIGGLFFLHGAFWMIQPIHKSSFADTFSHRLVMQSTNFSCVPAACATALNYLGMPTTEADMAQLTETRPVTGSTFFRAMDGLSRRLEFSSLEAQLVEPTPEQLAVLPTPIVCALRIEDRPRYSHMVVIFSINDKTVWVGDPDIGFRVLPRREFDAAFTGEAIVFHRKYNWR